MVKQVAVQRSKGRSAGLIGRARPAGVCLAVFTLVFSMIPGVSASDEHGRWGPPVQVQTSLVPHGSMPDIGVGENGNAVAVWQQDDSGIYTMWGAAYTPGLGWGRASNLQTVLHDGAGFPIRVAVDGAGDALAVWNQVDGLSNSIFADHHVQGLGWEGQQRIETDSGNAFRPEVAMNARGDGVAVWTQSDGVYENIWGNYFAAGVGWKGPLLVEASSSANGENPRVAIDEGGNATALWIQFDGVANSIYANRFTPASGWGAARLLETSGYIAMYGEVAADAAGGAMAVWTQWDGVEAVAFANRYAAGSGWGNAVAIATDMGIVYSPQVAMSARGDAVVVWQQFDGAAFSVMANRYTAGSSWGSATPIENYDLAPGGVQVSSDAAGNVVVVWQQSGDTDGFTCANRFTVGSGWGNATIIDYNAFGAAVSPRVALNAAGDGWAVWVQLDADGTRIWASPFTAPDNTVPALSLSAPAEGASLSGPVVRVAGTTEPGASVSVDGYAATVSAQGDFWLMVPLGAGSNRVTVTAVDGAGNAATVSVNVTYTDPVPGLQAQLAAAQAALAGEQAAANATAGQLAAIQVQLSQAAADAAAARSSANATAGQLATTQAALATTQGQLASTQTTLNQTRGASAPSGDTTVPLLVALGAMAVGAGGLVVGMRSGAAVSRVAGAAPKPAEERKPPT